MKTAVKTIYTPDVSKRQEVLLYEAMVPAGFPSPAADYQEDKLDLNRYLVKHPAATFFVRVTGDSMTGAGIGCGDLLVVDRGIEPKDKSVVLAVVDGEFTVKRIRIRREQITLEPENDSYTAREITEDTRFEVWGVVTSVIHEL
jgi:DNA polymerase V